MEALCDECIVKLIKVNTIENLADLNSKLPNIICFEYLVNKTMVHKELPTLKAAASANTEGSSIYESLVHALCTHTQPGDGYASKAYSISVHQQLRGHHTDHQLWALQLHS